MSQLLDVECPSGLVVQIREFKVKDEDLLADPRNIRQGVATKKLLEAITDNVVDYGPYEEGRLDWGQVLQGDAMVVLLKNRIATWGPDFVHKRPCENCKAQTEKEVNLEEDLLIKPLPEKSRDHVITNSPIGVTLPGCEVRVEFKLLRGRDEKQLAKLQKQKKDMRSSAYLRYRVTNIAGVAQNEWGKWLRELGAMDSSILRAAFHDADCGVDQEVEFECYECEHRWLDEVRFRTDFLFPKYRART